MSDAQCPRNVPKGDKYIRTPQFSRLTLLVEKYKPSSVVTQRGLGDPSCDHQPPAQNKVKGGYIG